MENEINTKELLKAMTELAETKGIDKQIIIDAMSEALKKAYLKASGDDNDTIVRVDFDEKSGKIKMFKIKNVVAEITDDVYETDPEEAFEATGVKYQVGDIIETPIDISAIQRVAVHLARNVFKQKLREAEKQIVYDQYSSKINDIITGTIDRVEKGHCFIKLNNTYAFLAKSKCLPTDNLIVGRPIKVYVEDVDKKAQGAQVLVSRTAPGFVSRLMEQDISEIYDGTVEIKSVARIAGVRTKVAVASKDPNIDPSGSCIGPKGTRIQRIIHQLGDQEKIDVINYSENPILYIADALKPAEVLGVSIVNKEEKTCIAILAQDQFSLAIGKEAQNVNLAVRLTGWKIDIKNIEDAKNLNIDYRLVEDEKIMEEAKKNAPKTTTPKKTVVDKFFEQTPVTTPKDYPTPTPIVEQEISPSVETKKEEEIIPTPTKESTTSFADLEAAFSSNTPTTSNQTSKPKPTKVKDKEKEKKEAKKVVKPSMALPVYTEEELRKIEEEEMEEEYDYDEDIDFDEFDEYYDK